MPETKIHSERKVKNYLIFGILLVFAIVVFSVTIVKMHMADVEYTNETKAQ